MNRHIETRTPEDCPACGLPAERVWSGPENDPRLGTSYYATLIPLWPAPGLRCQVCGGPLLPEKKEDV